MLVQGGQEGAPEGEITLQQATQLAVEIMGGEDKELAIMQFMDLVVARKLPGTDNLFRIPNLVGSPVKIQVRDDAMLALAGYGDAEIKAAIEIFFSAASYNPEEGVLAPQPHSYRIDETAFAGVVQALQLNASWDGARDAAAYFRAFDQDNSGVVDSKEYLLGVATLDAPVSLGGACSHPACSHPACSHPSERHTHCWGSR